VGSERGNLFFGPVLFKLVPTFDLGAVNSNPVHARHVGGMVTYYAVDLA
jgi:hypothetical protein